MAADEAGKPGQLFWHTNVCWSVDPSTGSLAAAQTASRVRVVRVKGLSAAQQVARL